MDVDRGLKLFNNLGTNFHLKDVLLCKEEKGKWEMKRI